MNFPLAVRNLLPKNEQTKRIEDEDDEEEPVNERRIQKEQGCVAAPPPSTPRLPRIRVDMDGSISHVDIEVQLKPPTHRSPSRKTEHQTPESVREKVKIEIKDPKLLGDRLISYFKAREREQKRNRGQKRKTRYQKDPSVFLHPRHRRESLGGFSKSTIENLYGPLPRRPIHSRRMVLAPDEAGDTDKQFDEVDQSLSRTRSAENARLLDAASAALERYIDRVSLPKEKKLSVPRDDHDEVIFVQERESIEAGHLSDEDKVVLLTRSEGVTVLLNQDIGHKVVEELGEEDNTSGTGASIRSVTGVTTSADSDESASRAIPALNNVEKSASMGTQSLSRSRSAENARLLEAASPALERYIDRRTLPNETNLSEPRDDHDEVILVQALESIEAGHLSDEGLRTRSETTTMLANQDLGHDFVEEVGEDNANGTGASSCSATGVPTSADYDETSSRAMPAQKNVEKDAPAGTLSECREFCDAGSTQTQDVAALDASLDRMEHHNQGNMRDVTFQEPSCQSKSHQLTSRPSTWISQKQSTMETDGDDETLREVDSCSQGGASERSRATRTTTMICRCLLGVMVVGLWSTTRRPVCKPK